MVESEASDDTIAVLESITFSMKTSSVETNDEGRNGKVAKFFFEKLTHQRLKVRLNQLEKTEKQRFL